MDRDPRRLLVVLCLASFLAVVNFAAASPFFPEIARDLDTTIPLLGQVTTALTLLSAVLGLGIGPLADRYGYRRLIVGGVVAVACNLLGTGLAPSYPALLMLAIVGGLGDAVLFGLPLAIAGTLFSGAARHRAVSLISAALPAGTVIGIPLLTAIGGVTGWRGVFVGSGVATLGVACLAAAWLPAESPSRDGWRRESLLAAYRPLLRNRSLLVVYGVSGLRAAAWVGMLIYLGAFLFQAFGFGPDRIGLAYMAAGVGVLLGSLATARILGRVPPRPLVAITTIGQGLLFAAIYTAPLSDVVTVALLAAAGFVGAMAFVGVATVLVEETPLGAATTMVLNGSIFNLGTAVGAALGGLLLAHGGFGALGVGLPAFAVVAGLLALMPTRLPQLRAR
jgi:MFS transporter, DHA1 family, inner membrane transport protein